jgi:hypothetical protein
MRSWTYGHAYCNGQGRTKNQSLTEIEAETTDKNSKKDICRDYKINDRTFIFKITNKTNIRINPKICRGL